MKAEIISVGSEILTGHQLNTDAQLVSELLRTVGIESSFQTSVRDDIKDVKSVLATALGRSNVIILTGGLGPTPDDITKDAVCELLGIKLVVDEPSLEKIRAYFFRKGEQMAENNVRQAMVPEGSEVIKNELGLSAGALLKSGNQCIVLLPGPPAELRSMLERSVIPYLKTLTNKTVVSKTVNVFGMSESLIAQSLSDLIENETPTVATYASGGKTDIFVSSCSEDFKTAIKDVDRAVEEIERRLGDVIYGIDEPSLHHAVVGELVANKLTVATAESCTGGLISKKITDISGASLCFEFGVTSYSEGIKNVVLGVNEETLSEFGAVSAETALQMAVGAMNTANSDFGVSVTGYAGPASMLGEPVGLVFISVCNRETAWVKRFELAITGKETREQIREMASLHAFDMIRRIMNGYAIFNSQRLPVSEVPNSIENMQSTKNKLIFAAPLKKVESDTQQEEPVKMVDKSFKGRLKAFFSVIFPIKEDSGSEKVRKCAFLTAAVALIVSVCYISAFFMGISKNEKLYTNLESLKNQTPSPSLVYPDGFLDEFGILYQENKDIAGWIEIKGTPLSYPVVQTKDNDFYLNHNFYGEKERHGTPFMDTRNNVEPLDFNTILHGHNMKSDNQMFSELENYYKGKNALNYYRKHPIINFDTTYRRDEWKIFAVFTCNVDSKNGAVFEYYNMINPENEEEFDTFLTQVRQKSIFNIPVDVVSTDNILTLSTCYYDFDGQRLVVMARRTRGNEDSSVDVNAATYNSGDNAYEAENSSTTSKDDTLWTSSTYSYPSPVRPSTSSRGNSTSSRYSYDYTPSSNKDSSTTTTSSASTSSAASTSSDATTTQPETPSSSETSTSSTVSAESPSSEASSTSQPTE